MSNVIDPTYLRSFTASDRDGTRYVSKPDAGDGSMVVLATGMIDPAYLRSFTAADRVGTHYSR